MKERNNHHCNTHHTILARLVGLRRRNDAFMQSPAGAAPGALVPTPDHAGPPAAQATLLRYDPDGVQQEAQVTLAQLAHPAPTEGAVLWLHLQGMPTSGQLTALGQMFGLHALALEDVQHRERRAKVADYETHQCVILSLVHRDAEGVCRVDQVTLFLGRFGLISINDGDCDVFEPVRQRIRGRSGICNQGADYLLYALIDAIVDTGFALLEQTGDELETLEDEILLEPGSEARNRIHLVRRELMLMRRAWWPQREAISTLMRGDQPWISALTRVYLRDCYDHGVVIVDFVETYREMAASLLDIYLSAISQRMNNIMKALTIAATIFLPLTFITGLYGMNFDTASPWNLPELHWRYGYPFALSLMLAVVVIMLWFFKRKHWW